MRVIVIALIALAICGAAHAGDLRVRVVNAGGQPIADAVVTFHPAQPPRGPIRFAWPYRLAQHNIAFEPRVLIVPVGATVEFPNLDTVRHHVYSFSRGNRFEIELYGRQEHRSFVFATAGVAAVGCNIHDQMAAHIVVVDTPFAAKTDAAGAAVLSGAVGAGRLRVWHPGLRTPENRMERAITIAPAGGAESFSLTLRPTQPAHH